MQHAQRWHLHVALEGIGKARQCSSVQVTMVSDLGSRNWRSQEANKMNIELKNYFKICVYFLRIRIQEYKKQLKNKQQELGKESPSTIHTLEIEGIWAGNLKMEALQRKPGGIGTWLQNPFECFHGTFGIEALTLEKRPFGTNP